MPANPNTQWTASVGEQLINGVKHTVATFDFGALGVKITVDCTSADSLLVRHPPQTRLLVNDEIDEDTSGQPNVVEF